jgi:hypothetical protein
MELDKYDEERKGHHEKLKAAFDEFLRTYHEDSTLRVSRGRFEDLVQLMHEVAVRQDEMPCSNCGRPRKPSPELMKVVCVRVTPERIVIIGSELKSKTIRWVNKTMAEVKDDLRDSGSSHLPPASARATLLLFVKPKNATLEDLAGVGVRPFHIVQWLRNEIDQVEFSIAAMDSTQNAAMA